MTTVLDAATARDGSQICYARFGNDNSSENRIALLHSLAMDHQFWRHVVAELAGEAEIIAIDARGHGKSDKPKGPYSTELFADDLASVFDHAGWSTAVVAGASMGGCVSLAFAARHRSRVSGLCLIDTTACYGEGAIEAWEERGQKAIAGGMQALTGFQTSRWFSDTFCEEQSDLVEENLAVFMKNDTAAYLETCRMLARCDSRDDLNAFDFPVEILVGEQDYATPVSMAEAMRDAIPDAELTVVPDVRHYTPIEIPVQVADRIRAVLARR